MTETFLPVPILGAARTRRQRKAEVTYGDGYVHRTSIGINIDLDAWEVSFAGEFAYIDSIDKFFTDNSLQGFWWTPPGAVDPILVTCAEWTVTYNDVAGGKPMGSVTTTFTREYNFQPIV